MLVFLVGTFANVTIAYLIMTVIVDNRSNTPVVIKNINWREPFAVVMCPMPNNPLRWQLTEESNSTYSTCETSARDLPSCLPRWQRLRVYELLFPLISEMMHMPALCNLFDRTLQWCICAVANDRRCSAVRDIGRILLRIPCMNKIQRQGSLPKRWLVVESV